jgi:opacity protein-like surface antigen
MLKTALKTIKTVFLSIPFIVPSHAMDQFFAGLNVGRAFIDSSLNRELAINTKDTSNMGNHDLLAGIFLGYTNSIAGTPLFVGFEFGAQYQKIFLTKEENTFPPYIHYVTNIKTNGSVTGVLKLGVKIKDMLLYAKGGTSWTNWTINFSDRTNTPWKTKSCPYNKFGTLLGFGIDYVLNCHWAIGLDYSHTTYPSLKLVNHVGGFKATSTLHTTSFRLTYLF